LSSAAIASAIRGPLTAAVGVAVAAAGVAIATAVSAPHTAPIGDAVAAVPCLTFTTATIAVALSTPCAL